MSAHDQSASSQHHHTPAADAKADKELHQVAEGLFVGSQFAAANEEALRAHNVKHILCVTTGVEVTPPEGVTVHTIPIRDVGSEDITPSLDKCYETVAEAIKEGGVLIHCSLGISRSPTVTTAYLIKSQKISFDEAFDNTHDLRSYTYEQRSHAILCRVKQARPQSDPNAGFREQLRKYAALNASNTPSE